MQRSKNTNSLKPKCCLPIPEVDVPYSTSSSVTVFHPYQLVKKAVDKAETSQYPGIRVKKFEKSSNLSSDTRDHDLNSSSENSKTLNHTKHVETNPKPNSTSTPVYEHLLLHIYHIPHDLRGDRPILKSLKHPFPSNRKTKSHESKQTVDDTK
jgi:hypothetical protein